MRNNYNNGVLINKKLNVWIIKSYLRSSGKISSGLPWITNSRVPNFLKFHDWWLFTVSRKKAMTVPDWKYTIQLRHETLLVVRAHTNPNISRFDLIWFLEVVKTKEPADTFDNLLFNLNERFYKYKILFLSDESRSFSDWIRNLHLKIHLIK